MNRAEGQFGETASGWWYRCQWRVEGKRYSVRGHGYPNKKAAREALRRAMRDKEEGRSATVAGTLEEYLTTWLDTFTRSGAVKRSTAVTYSDHITRHIIPRLGSITLSKLSPNDIAKFYADLLSEGETRHKSGRGLSPKTVRNIAQTLKKALRDGVKFGNIARNVAEGVDLPRYEKPELQAWTNDQLQHFIAHASKEGDYLLPIWYLLGTAPLRRGEVCGLRWQDVDLVESQVHIRQTRLVVHGVTIGDTPKSKTSRRSVAIGSAAVIALAHLRNAQEAAAEKLGSWPSDLVLTDLDGQAIDPEALTRRFYSATKRAGLPQIRLHSMRHTWASWALSEGESIHVVAGFLGHSDPGFTLRTYAPFMPNQARDTADRLSSKLSALLEGRIGANLGANISQLVVAEELPSSESA